MLICTNRRGLRTENKVDALPGISCLMKLVPVTPPDRSVQAVHGHPGTLSNAVHLARRCVPKLNNQTWPTLPTMTLFGLGPNELLLSIHGLIFILIVGFASYIFGAIYFKRIESETYVKRLKISALVTFLLVLGLMISGMLPDTNFGSGATLTASYTNNYGNFTQSISDASVGAFTGPLLFDMMEHISFIGLTLTAIITYLIWNYGELVITDMRVKWSILSLIIVTGAWLIVLGVVGTIMTKTLTFPPGV